VIDILDHVELCFALKSAWSQCVLPFLRGFLFFSFVLMNIGIIGKLVPERLVRRKSKSKKRKTTQPLPRTYMDISSMDIVDSPISNIMIDSPMDDAILNLDREMSTNSGISARNNVINENRSSASSDPCVA